MSCPLYQKGKGLQDAILRIAQTGESARIAPLHVPPTDAKLPRTAQFLATIVGLLATAAIFYAVPVPHAVPVPPTPFATFGPPNDFPGVTGVAAGPADLLASEYCGGNIDSIGCAGNISVLATIPGIGADCEELYLAMVPLTSGPPNNT
jgi:hypothetical protein